MKRFLVYLLAVCALAGLVTFAAPQVSAAGHADHCVCGGSAVGVGDHTQCQNITWKPLSSVATLSQVDFGKIASGNYYLDGDVTVSNWNSLGKLSTDTLATAPAATVTLRLCLNGCSVTSRDRVFGPIYMGSELSICDCSGVQSADGSWSWQGSMSGGGNVYGGIIYGHAGSTINVYGGNLTGKATRLGGAFAAASDSCGDVNGDDTCDDKDKNQARGCVISLYNGHVTGNTVSAVVDSGTGKAAHGSGGTFNLMHSAVMNLYGGTVSGGSAVSATGTNGTVGGKGGNISAGKRTTLNIQGGTVTGGNAVLGGNIYCEGTFVLNNATVSNGTAVQYGNIYSLSTVDPAANSVYGGYPEAVHVVTVQDGKETLSQGYTLADALAHLTDNSYLKLTRDLTGETEISGTVYLDMNGCDLSGVTITGTLYGFDSTTDAYTGDNAGKLTCTLDGGQVVSEHKTEEALIGAIRRYLTVSDGSSYSFHRFYIGMTAVTLRPGQAGMGYRATFAGDEALREYLADTKAYGYELWIREDTKVTRGYGAERFGGVQELTLGLNNILSQSNDLQTNLENAETAIHAVAYIQLENGQRIESSQVSYDFKDVIHKADAAYESYHEAQQNALQFMSAQFSETFMTWDIANTHHAQGGIWTSLDQQAFLAKLVKTSFVLSESTTYTLYCLPEGSYVLTEDVDLGSKTLGILPGTKTAICLNGHTITSSNRTLRIIGQIDLCDCHGAGQEGTVTSTYGTFAPVFYVYWGGQFNLHGGNLYAAQSYAHTGVGAISHDGGTLNTDKASGVMNMYGGTISSDGQVSGSGGLVSMWNSTIFNMYGGEMYGGTAANGGAVRVASGCAFNMYGGTIHDNTATNNGGAVYMETATATVGLYGGTVTCNSSGVYAKVGNVELSGLVTVTDNTDYDLKLAGSELRVQDLDPGSRIGLTTGVRGYLCDDPGLAECFALRDMSELTVQEYNGKLMLLPAELAEFGSVSTFSIGYSTVCTNPENPVGLPLAGYGNTSNRLSTQVIDDLYTSVVAMSDENDHTVLLYTCDIQRIPDATSNSMRRHISNATGVPFENIYISATHTHSAPDLTSGMSVIEDYKVYLTDQMVQIALEAMADRQPSQAQYGAMEVEGMNFVRHYYYYDENGDKQYCGDNFGIFPSDLSASSLFHATKGDHSLQVIRFVRDGKDVVLANWAAHPHFTGGSSLTNISADYVAPFRDAVQTNEDCYFAFIQGAGGNMNETSSITGETRYARSKYQEYGRKMAEYVSQLLDNMTDVPTGLIRTDSAVCTVPVNHTEDDKAEQAKALRDIYYTWKDETFPAENGRTPNSTEVRQFCMSYGFQSIYHAGAVISKSGRGETVELEVNVFSIGSSLGFYTGPGELWSDTALEIKGGSPFPMTFTVGYTNQNWNYFPDGDAAGGYENYESQLSHLLFPDTIEILKVYWHETLDRLYENAQ